MNNKSSPTLTSERLILRAFRPSDLLDFYAYAKKATIGPAAGWKPHESIQESENILNIFVNEPTLWAIYHTQDQKVIGSIGLHIDRCRKNETVRSLGFVIDDQYWGQGLMVEAAAKVIEYGFQQLNLSLISVGHYTGNNRSKRVIEKCGFAYEATLKQAHVLFDGSIHDINLYILLKEDYQKKLK